MTIFSLKAKNHFAVCAFSLVSLLSAITSLAPQAALTANADDTNLKLCISDWPSNMFAVALYKMNRLKDVKLNQTEFQTCVKRFEKGLEDLMIISNTDYIQFRNQGLDFTIIDIEDNSTGGDGVVIKKGLLPKDLKGKKIGLQIDSISILALDLFLKKNGLALADVKLVDLKAENVAKAIPAGKADAVVTWNPTLQEAAKNGGEIVFTTKEAKENIFDLVVVRNSVLSNPKKKAALKHYVAEWHKGTTEEPVRNKLAEVMKVSVADLNLMLADAEIYKTKAEAKAAIPRVQAVLFENVKTFSAPAYKKMLTFAKTIPEKFEMKMYDNCCSAEFLE